MLVVSAQFPAPTAVKNWPISGGTVRLRLFAIAATKSDRFPANWVIFSATICSGGLAGAGKNCVLVRCGLSTRVRSAVPCVTKTAAPGVFWDKPFLLLGRR